MKTYKIRFGAIAAFLGLASLIAAAPRNKEKPSLKVGDPAPPLTIGAWIKGEPVPTLKKGTVYVVEAWATWCGPCRVSIPHLTELQKKHKDAVFIGVAVSDEKARVKDFVEKMGDTMDYRVAVDDKGKTGKHWLAASGSRGIPSAFVVDKAGKIAWFGHPMKREFEAAVETALQAEGPDIQGAE